MKLLLILCPLTVACAITASAQADSTFSIMRSGHEAKFPFIKFTKSEQLSTFPNSSLPIYAFDKTQYSRIKGLLYNFALIENDYKQMLIVRDKKDSVATLKERTLTESFKLQEERAKNFEASYNSLLSVNKQLNDQLKNAEQLAKAEHRKKKLKPILVGVLALSAGVIIGRATK